MTLVLRGGVVVDPRGARSADVLVEGDRIRGVGELSDVRDAEVLDLGGDLVIPGLVNAHHHSPDGLATGTLPIAPLELWSLASVSARSLSPDQLRLAALFSAAQLLRGGVTAVVDMVRPWPTPTLEAFDAVAAAYADSGMRAAVAIVVADLPVERTLPLGRWTGAAADAGVVASQLDVVREVVRRWHGRDGRISVHVAPSGPQRCSDELFAGAIDLARATRTLLHTHALETLAQAEQARRRWGRPLVAHLERIGALGPSTVLAHVVWPEADDPGRLAASGAVVVHNPASNAALGSGLAPVPAMREAGVTLALGTDAASCNDGLSMFEAMKLATTVHRPGEPDWHRWPTPADALRWATEGGAAALGLGTEVGRIEAGRLADIVVLDARAAAFVPPNDLRHQLVMRAAPDAVRHVFVGGRQVVRDGELLTIEWPSLVDEIVRAAPRAGIAPPDAALVDAVAALLRATRSA